MDFCAAHWTEVSCSICVFPSRDSYSGSQCLVAASTPAQGVEAGADAFSLAGGLMTAADWQTMSRVPFITTSQRENWLLSLESWIPPRLFAPECNYFEFQQDEFMAGEGMHPSGSHHRPGAIPITYPAVEVMHASTEGSKRKYTVSELSINSTVPRAKRKRN